MQTIYKYQLPVGDEFTVRMPMGAQLLCVQTQGGEPCVWALVESNAEMTTRKFAVRGTGHDADWLDRSQYVGTFQLNGGALVFHLFDRGER